MIPLRDENPSRTTPVVTRGLIALNAAVFFYELWLGPELRDFILAWGMIPARLGATLEVGGEPLAWTAATFVSSMFLHGGWAHMIGNVWYLWIFGDNVEDRLGSLRFLLFYLGAGICASLLHTLTNVDSNVPTVGASGAIAGVLGAYAVTFPGARVITLVPLFPFFQVIPIPAILVLGLWFVFQILSGTLSLGMGGAGGGVAWWAHIGGFVFGVVVARMAGRRPPPSRADVAE